MQLLSWTDINDKNEIRQDKFALCCAEQSWKLSEAPNDNFLLFLGPLNGYYTLDPESLDLNPLDHLNAHALLPFDDDTFLKVYIEHDQSGNLLIVSGSLFLDGKSRDDYENLQAMIWSSDGNWTDISSSLESERSKLFMSSLDWKGKFFAFNFLQDWGG